MYHKVKSANFGETVNIFNETFFTIIKEQFMEEKKFDDFTDWISRTTNSLSALFGFAHSSLNEEMEMLTLPFYKQLFKKIKKYRQKKNMDIKKKS